MTEAIGKVVSLWRYPVKSMLGEEVNASTVTSMGLLGDRAYALADPITHKIGSAKNPKNWPNLLHFRACYVGTPQPGKSLPDVRIEFPDGRKVISTAAELDGQLSREFGRQVKLEMNAPHAPSLEEYWPQVEGLTHQDVVTDEAMPPGTFFDCAKVHVLTTATVNRLRELLPESRFEVRRFRPNIVVELSNGKKDFVENGWVNGTLMIGDKVQLNVSGPCPRCVMTTLEQGDLPQDLGILRTAAKHNSAHVGVYAGVKQAGSIRRGDAILFKAN